MCVSSYVRQIHVVYCTHLAEVILKDGGKIKPELLEPLIIFLEIIKANKWAFGELDLDAVLVAQTLAGQGSVWCPFPWALVKEALGAHTGSSWSSHLSSVWWNAVLSDYHSLHCAAHSSTSVAAATSFSWREGNHWVQEWCLCNDFRVCWVKGIWGDVMG